MGRDAGVKAREKLASLGLTENNSVMEWVHSFISLYFTLISVVINFVKQVLLLNFPHARTCIIGE